MNTFLPFPEFDKSAQVLDRQRLGKQRVEVLQLLKGQWPNHPAAKMWRGYEHALGLYGLAICREWKARSYKDTCYEKIEALLAPHPKRLPPWLGDDAFHRAHQSNLVRKLPEHYRRYFPEIPDSLPYIWP